MGCPWMPDTAGEACMRVCVVFVVVVRWFDAARGAQTGTGSSETRKKTRNRVCREPVPARPGSVPIIPGYIDRF